MDPKFYEIGPGWPAFVATFALTIAVIVLFRSLNKHLRKVRLHAIERETAASQPVAAPAAHGANSLGLSVEDGDGRGDVVADEAGHGQ